MDPVVLYLGFFCDFAEKITGLIKDGIKFFLLSATVDAVIWVIWSRNSVLSLESEIF